MSSASPIRPRTTEIKLVVLGGGGVGKSALTVQFVQGVYLTKYDPTIEDSYRKSIEADGKMCILDILDTAGTDQFSSMRDLYMRDGDGFILVYSIVSRATFVELEAIYEQLERVRDGAKVPLIVVGNKSDLLDRRMVSVEEGKAMAEKWGGSYMETSAKTCDGLDDVFMGVVKKILMTRALAERAQPSLKRVGRNGACTVL